VVHCNIFCWYSKPSSWKARTKTILKATKTHALNLAKFAFIYKTLLLIQRKANGGKERSLDTFVAGLVGGYTVFGDRTAINEQVRTSLPNRTHC
jgi:peroxisomal membrane protein 4